MHVNPNANEVRPTLRLVRMSSRGLEQMYTVLIHRGRNSKSAPHKVLNNVPKIQSGAGEQRYE